MDMDHRLTQLETTFDEAHAITTGLIERAHKMLQWPSQRTRTTTEEMDGRVIVTTIVEPVHWTPADAVALMQMARELQDASAMMHLALEAMHGGNPARTGAD
jgi:hypothetical protein